MGKRMLLLSAVLTVVGLGGSAVLALDPMGSPTAGLLKGRLSAGVDYSFSEMDLKFNEGRYTGGGILHSFKSKDFRMNKVYATFGYGIMDKWEAFLRLGRADAQFKNDHDDKFNGDTDFSIGFGTKVTFCEANDLSWGGLFQVSWAKSHAETYVNWSGYGSSDMWSDDVRIDVTEIQIAAGPNYRLMDGVCIYGGPFLHYVDGDVDGKWHSLEDGSFAGDETYDIDETSYFGGYIGVKIDLVKNVTYGLEYQHTAAADALGMSLIWRF